MSAGVEFDDKQVLMMLNNLTGKEIKKAAVSTLRKAGNILARKTVQNFKATGIGLATVRKETIKKRNGKTKLVTRRIASVRVDRKKLSAKVHIMDDYRVKWFEKGTRERKWIRPPFKESGKIEPQWFFRDAQNQTESKIFSTIDKELSKQIIKIANKKTKV